MTFITKKYKIYPGMCFLSGPADLQHTFLSVSFHWSTWLKDKIKQGMLKLQTSKLTVLPC